MLKARGIAMSDGLNRKNHYFSLKSIINAYEDVWEKGTPSKGLYYNSGHDDKIIIY